MKKFRLISLVLLILLLTNLVSAAAPLLPYAIKVNRAWNTVTIYTHDENGQYTVPVKAMICSTARPGYVTPTGSFRLAQKRSEWRLMLDGTYGQYATCFSGNYLFHSICYEDDRHDAMKRDSYNNLGNAASMGCVRLETIDAKWIFDNCPAGTPVTVYEDYDSPGPLGKPNKTVNYIPEEGYTGWDPTDPAEGNPWHTAEITEIELSETELSMQAGESTILTETHEPELALTFWTSSDKSVVNVENGKVIALSAGEATITLSGLKGLSAQCTVTVEGELLPYDDLTPGAWYYPEVRQAMEQDLFRGLGNRTFAPNASVTRAMVVQILFKLAGSPQVQTAAEFADVAEDAWYADAVNWAVQKGVVNGVSADSFAPDVPMTRQDLAAVLWRYASSPKTVSDLSEFDDGDQVASYAETAMAWMTEQGYLKGSDGCLQPSKTASRAETAAIFLRYKK